MRKIYEILRLKWERGLSHRQIAESCQVARPTVTDYLERATAAGLAWPLPAEMDEAALEQLLFPPRAAPAATRQVVPDWAAIHAELQRKGVTLFLLWHEYKLAQPSGYGYTWFCTHYQRWAQKLDLVMRHDHRAGEKLFVDYAGSTVPVQDAHTGAVRQAQIFVAVLGASSYTYLEATWSQSLPDWIGSHVRAFTFFGGVPEVVIPDNLRSGVSAAHRYEPQINPTYQDLASHYGVAILPARSRKPRDKAKVENAVLVTERWILARLRRQTFFTLAALNDALRTALTDLNLRPFQKLPGSRHSRFTTLERPALRPLPLALYEYAEWKKATVHIDYHVEVDHHYYSVPYALVRQQLDVRLTAHCVECFHKGQRVSSHRRSSLQGHHTTLTEHMPQAHQAYAEWTPERLGRWAQQSGPATAQLVGTILATRAHPLQGFRSCLGIMRLGKTYGADRLEAACARALALDAHSYKSVASILRHGLDQQPLTPDRVSPPSILHSNLRGPHYYHSPRQEPAMLRHPTLDKLHTLRLPGMSSAFLDQLQLPDMASLSFEERLGLLVDRELTDRENRRLQSRLRQAKLRQPATLEDLDYRAPRGLDKAFLTSLASAQWIADHHNVLITGATGVGKTWLACALAHAACRQGYRVQYLRVPRLWRELAIARGDGRYTKLLAALAKLDLLVLDDLGLAPLTDDHRRDFLELLEDRHAARATLVTSQLPVEHWHEVIGDPTLADAILDRLVHNAYKIPLKGESMRKRTPKLTSPAPIA